MQYILLTREQVELAARRFREHGNSPGRIARHYRAVDEDGALRTCLALRRLERKFGLNIGTICHKFLEKENGPTPRVQQEVMNYVAAWHALDGDAETLVVSVDRVREIDRLAQGDGEPWPTSLDS